MQAGFDPRIGQRRVSSDIGLQGVIPERQPLALAAQRSEPDRAGKAGRAAHRRQLAIGAGPTGRAARQGKLGRHRRHCALPAVVDPTRARQRQPDRAVIGRDQPASIAHGEIDPGQPGRLIARSEDETVERTEAQRAVAIATVEPRLDQRDRADRGQAEAVAQPHDNAPGGEIGRLRIAQHHVRQHLAAAADAVDGVAGRNAVGVELAANDVVGDSLAREPGDKGGEHHQREQETGDGPALAPPRRTAAGIVFARIVHVANDPFHRAPLAPYPVGRQCKSSKLRARG